jgi:biopolymer transport protein ExbD
MHATRRRNESARRIVEGDVEILPLMNLFVVLIPMLLLSAVFLRIAVIDMSLPAGAGESAAPEEDPLSLTVRIEEDRYVVEGRGIPDGVVLRDGGGEENAAELSERLAGLVAARPGTEDVVILSRTDTRYEEIVRVMDAAREAGLSRASLGSTDGAGREDAP